MKLKTILFFTTSFFLVLLILFKSPQGVFAQEYAYCCASGTSCTFVDCPGGWELVEDRNVVLSQCVTENTCSTSLQEIQRCQDLGYSRYGYRYNCRQVADDPSLACPDPYSICIDAGSTETCELIGISQACTISAGVTGNCCQWQDEDTSVGGHLQPCAGAANNACDPFPLSDEGMQLSCESTVGYSERYCCYGAEDPACEGLAPVDLPECPTCVRPEEDCPEGLVASTLIYNCTAPTTKCCSESGRQRVFCDSLGRPTIDSSSQQIYTAIGCIPVGSNEEFGIFLLRWGMGIGGGIAFVMIVYAGIMIITSAGNPQRVAAGKELLTAALMGLVLLVFSVFILRFIGVDILALPGF
jgi:hypothetical protein